jgi:DNA-binding winged helix-turn-helix (wHTH) protein
MVTLRPPTEVRPSAHSTPLSNNDLDTKANEEEWEKGSGGMHNEMPKIKPDSPAHKIVQKRYIAFGPYYLDRKQRLLFHNDKRLNLNGKSYEALLLLLDRAGDVVSREELYSALWHPQTMIDMQANLNTTMNKLRNWFKDSTGSSCLIETVKGLGYVVTVEVQYLDTLGGQPQRQESGSSSWNSPQGTPIFYDSSQVWWWFYSFSLVVFGIIIGGVFEIWWAKRLAEPIFLKR